MTSAAERPSQVGHEEGSRLSFAAGGRVAPVEVDLLRAHAFAALAALLVSSLFGTIVAIKLVQPDFLSGAACDGAGPAAAGLSPRPANLRESHYSTPALASTLWNGVAGSSMSAWRELSATDLASLVTHVQVLHPQPGGAGSSASPETLARGATVYAVNCVSCHGANGDGHGPAARALLPRPADLTLSILLARVCLTAHRPGSAAGSC